MDLANTGSVILGHRPIQQVHAPNEPTLGQPSRGTRRAQLGLSAAADVTRSPSMKSVTTQLSVRFAACLGLMGACAGPETSNGSDDLVSDTALYALVQTSPGVSFHPPLGPSAVYERPFDPTLLERLVVLLEATDSSGGTASIATFSGNTTPRLNVHTAFEVYSVDLDASSYFTDPGLAYRFTILLDGARIGRSDLSSRVFEFMERTPNLRVGVKLRAEVGVIPCPESCAISSAPVSSSDGGELTTDGAALGLPGGSLVADSWVSLARTYDILESNGDGPDTGHIPLTPSSSPDVFVLREYQTAPAALALSGPARISVTYDDATVTMLGREAADLQLFEFRDEDRTWVALPLVERDTENRRLTTTISRLGRFALGLFFLSEEDDGVCPIESNGCTVPAFAGNLTAPLYFGAAIFDAACDRHDHCYDHGAVTYGKDQAACDLDLLGEMRARCHLIAGRALFEGCMATAELIYSGVHNLGWQFYHPASSCCAYSGEHACNDGDDCTVDSCSTSNSCSHDDGTSLDIAQGAIPEACAPRAADGDDCGSCASLAMDSAWWRPRTGGAFNCASNTGSLSDYRGWCAGISRLPPSSHCPLGGWASGLGPCGLGMAECCDLARFALCISCCDHCPNGNDPG